MRVVALEEEKAGKSSQVERSMPKDQPHRKGAVGGMMQPRNRPVKQILAECNR